MNSFGKRLKELRYQKGWTVHALGTEIKKSGSYVSQMERGVKIPNLILLKTLSKKFNVHLFVLVTLAIRDRNKREVERIRKEYGR